MTNPNPHPFAPAPPAKKSRTLLVLAIIAGVLALTCLLGVVAAAIGSSSDDTPAAVLDQDQANRNAATATPTTATTTSPAAAPTTTKPAKPAPVRIGEGSYRVGEDIPAGRYKAVERADSNCYWSREKGTDIIDNNIGGGFPQFTTRNGEDVTVGVGCPEFERQ